jgi:hypothetical protein
LKTLAAAHGMTIDTYLQELAKRSRRSSRKVSTGRSPRAANIR